MKDVYKNINDYVKNEILIIFDDMIAGMISDKKLYSN